jgi:SAM-dependent methyltransferase
VGKAVEDVFADIYRRRVWGDGESRSGRGSGLVRTAEIRADLGVLLGALGVRSMLDAGCGDFHWMQAADLPITSYIGADVVQDLIDECRARYATAHRRFVHCDIAADPLPRVDLILCRDVLPHLSFADIARTIANFRASGAAWLLTNTFDGRPHNDDIPTGAWRPLNFRRPPFSWPPPSGVIDERCYHTGGAYADKRLALWALAAVR